MKLQNCTTVIQSDLQKALYNSVPDTDTFSNQCWDISQNKDDRPTVGPRDSKSAYSDVDESEPMQSVQSASSKHFKFVDEEPISTPFDKSFVQFSLSKTKQRNLN